MNDGDVDNTDGEVRFGLDLVGSMLEHAQKLADDGEWSQAATRMKAAFNILVQLSGNEIRNSPISDTLPSEKHIVSSIKPIQEPTKGTYLELTLDDGNKITLLDREIPDGAQVGNLIVDVSYTPYGTGSRQEPIKCHDLRIGTPAEVGAIILDRVELLEALAEE